MERLSVRNAIRRSMFRCSLFASIMNAGRFTAGYMNRIDKIFIEAKKLKN